MGLVAPHGRDLVLGMTIMSETTERFKSQLACLSAHDRAELAHFLIDSLDPGSEAEAAWDQELARREAEIRSGNAAGKPADEVLAEL